jgi:UDP-N-acetylmuramate: L-alanyl-gamma-D-glutamyl-meso-diaminopimelate ligase
VTGCDANVYPPMSDQLRQLGIELIEGYGADQMALKPDMYVVGNVVSRKRLPDGSPKFPLMEAILDTGAAYTSGPQWLAEHVLRGRHVLAVAGTHGKTTTTSMLTWVLECAGLQPVSGRRRAAGLWRLRPPRCGRRPVAGPGPVGDARVCDRGR